MRQILEVGCAYEVFYPVGRESHPFLGVCCDDTRVLHLQKMIPLDRNTVLKLGCGIDRWDARIAVAYPWMHVTVCGDDAEFIIRSKSRSFPPSVSFIAADYSNLPLCEESFDCVFIDNTLEYGNDFDSALFETFRVLRQGGALVVAMAGEVKKSSMIFDNQVRKAASQELRFRLEGAGFSNYGTEEVDISRNIGFSPDPLKEDNIHYVTAWKRKKIFSRLERALEIMEWVYRRLSPEKSQSSNDPVDILAGGYALCWGYTVVLGRLLQREGFNVKWMTMLAKNLAQGRGRDKIDSHEVLSVEIDETEIIMDPMANVWFPHSLSEILKQPDLAVEKENPDDRYVERVYRLYASSYWYSRVFKYAIRKDPNKRVFLWKRNR